MRISTSKPFPKGLARLARPGSRILDCDEVVVETDAEFHARLRAGLALGPLAIEDDLGLERTSPTVHRIRVAGVAPLLTAVLGGDPRVARYDGEVTTEGRVELLPFLREQAVSITAHRYGNPDPAFVELDVR